MYRPNFNTKKNLFNTLYECIKCLWGDRNDIEVIYGIKEGFTQELLLNIL